MIPIVKTVQLSNELIIPYAEQGDSSSVSLILLHGYADSWHSFEPLLLHLPGTVHAFALTQRGHGDASRPAEGYSSSDFATDLEEFMDALHLDVAVIVGGSSGGFAARRFAINHPQRTLGLVLLGSPLTLHDKTAVLELWDSTISKLTDPVNPRFVREFVESTLSQRVPQAFVETLVQESLKVPAHVWKAVLNGLLEDDSAEEIQKIQAPTLIVWGDQDTIVSRKEQESMASAIPNSRLLVYPGAGHTLYCEEPAHLASDLLAFITNLH